MSEEQMIAEQFWRAMFTQGGDARERRQRFIFKVLPGSPRCKLCSAPLDGFGGSVVRVLYNKVPSNLNPYFCNVCDLVARKYPGGAEVEMSMLFADIRGSTALSESMSPTDFSHLINRFYVMATNVLARADSVIGRLAGDSVAAFWGAGMAGPDYIRKTVEAAHELLHVTGHMDPEGPWAPLGIGVHAGWAFYGTMGTGEGMYDITAVGEEVNLAARLAAQAGPGEILISEPVLAAVGLHADDLEQRTLNLKGISRAVQAHVINLLEAENA